MELREKERRNNVVCGSTEQQHRAVAAIFVVRGFFFFFLQVFLLLSPLVRVRRPLGNRKQERNKKLKETYVSLCVGCFGSAVIRI